MPLVPNKYWYSLRIVQVCHCNWWLVDDGIDRASRRRLTKSGSRLYFSQNDLVILILVPVRRNDQPLVLVTLWHDPVRTIMGVQKDVQPWRSQDPTFFQHGGKLFVWGLLAFSRISDKPKIVDLMLVAHYGESPSLRPMSAVRSEWPHVPDARKVVLVDAVSGHRATLWQVRGHLPMPTDGPSTTTVAAMV